MVEQLFCKQQVVGSIPITGSIFLKLNQADFGESQRSITEKCPPNAHQFLTSHKFHAQKGPGLSPGPLLFDRYEEVGKVATILQSTDRRGYTGKPTMVGYFNGRGMLTEPVTAAIRASLETPNSA